MKLQVKANVSVIERVLDNSVVIFPWDDEWQYETNNPEVSAYVAVKDDRANLPDGIDLFVQSNVANAEDVYDNKVVIWSFGPSMEDWKKWDLYDLIVTEMNKTYPELQETK